MAVFPSMPRSETWFPLALASKAHLLIPRYYPYSKRMEKIEDVEKDVFHGP